jgi:NitT/TauT family transport system permease protein
MSEAKKIRLLQIAFCGGVLFLWESGARLALWDTTWTSSPTLIWNVFWASLLRGEILYHAGVTLLESFSGLLAGCLIGVILGVFLSISRILGAAAEPFVIALNCLPRVALAPLVVMFLGIGFLSKFLLAFSLVVVPIMINTYEGIRAADPIWIDTLRIFRANRKQMFLKVLLPNCVPWIFSGIRVSITLSIIGAIVGEFISARAGIGYMIDVAAGGFDVTGMLMPLFVLMFLAFGFDRLVLFMANRLLRWREASV